MKYSILLLLSILTITSCNNNNQEQVANDTSEDIIVASNEVDDLIYTIDSDLENKPVVKSLVYTKEDHTMIDVTAYLDQNNLIQKIEEYYRDGASGMVTKKWFYLNGGELFASRLIHEVKDGGEASHYEETVTSYDESNKAIESKTRTAEYEEYLELESYQKDDIIALSTENAMKILNQEGPYATTFQGFVDAGAYEFLIVGANEKNGYTSSLSIQFQSGVLMHLKKQGEKAIGEKLVVNFERYLDNQGYEIQLLTDLKLAEK